MNRRGDVDTSSSGRAGWDFVGNVETYFGARVYTARYSFFDY